MFSLQERFSSFELTQNTISKRKGPKAIGRFKVEVILLARTIVARTFGTLSQIFSNTSIISSPPPPLNNVDCPESNTSRVSCTVSVLQHCSGGAGERTLYNAFEGFMSSPIFKLLTKRLRKGQVSLNKVEVILLARTIVARTFGTLSQIFSNTSIISSPPPPLNNVDCPESNTSRVSCTVSVLQHCSGGAGERTLYNAFEGFMSSPIFKLLTKRLRKGQVSLNKVEVILLARTIVARTFGTLSQIFSNTSIISSPPPPLNNVDCPESNTSRVSCTVSVLQHCSGGAGERTLYNAFEGFMSSPIFKLLTKRLRKGQVSLNQLARIVGEVFSGLGDMKRFNMRISLFSIVRKTLEDEVIRFIKTVHAVFDNS